MDGNGSATGAEGEHPREAAVTAPKTTFLDHVMSRVRKVMGHRSDSPVTVQMTKRRWSMPTVHHAVIFIGLAKKYGLKVFRQKGARGVVIWTEGPLHVHRDMKRFAWTPLVEAISAQIEQIFREHIAPTSGVDFSPEVYENLEQVEIAGKTEEPKDE